MRSPYSTRRVCVVLSCLLTATTLAAQPAEFEAGTRTLDRRGPGGELLERTVVRADGQPTRVELYNAGQLRRATAFAYDAAGQLTEEVASVTEPHGYTYDLVRRYSYADGQLTGLLYGNNSSGRWGSEAYAYDAHGDRTRIDHFRKDGTLAYQTTFEHTRDASGRIAETVRRKMVLPVDSLHGDWEDEVGIGAAAVPEAGEVRSAYAKTSYRYDDVGRVVESVERDADDRERLRVTTRYLPGGGRRETTRFADAAGGFTEAITYDRLGRVVQRELAGEVTRYRYYGQTGVVRGVE